MRRITGLIIIAAIGSAAFAKTVNLNGTVSNSKGTPIAGAIVRLASQNLADTTDLKGAYALIHVDAAVGSAMVASTAESVLLDRGILRLSLTRPSRVRVDLHDMRGALLERTIDRDAAAGEYRLNLAAHPLACRMLVVRAWIGGNASTFRYLPLNAGGEAIFSPTPSFSVERGLMKIETTVDSLTATASGFTAKTVKIASYQTTANITLDSNTSSLAKFSFFITSLKALQTLSGNTKGFGGDFRFGKTGQGAGLLGADSICQCIAEKSMPGSKVKQWRAFLSDSAGPDGKQVNAIDRIGQGPWYDRLGRVVSPNLQGLLATRPNADAAIKNDLPNEEGIPNHRPDPNAATVDNHHMVTGSNTSGKLSGSTCNDWTSKVDAASGGKSGGGPLCGFAWPRNMAKTEGGNASHWISGFTASGCSPSVETQTMVGIGGGGGYGGFYCFALTP
jgi:hypothetical protein